MEQLLLCPSYKDVMNSYLFESFSKMIDKLPPKGVILAAERECQLLENDLATNRPVPKQEAHSILSFCRFLSVAKTGLKVPRTVLAPGHTAFYRRTLDRLIEAGELPETARPQFDEFFTVPLLQSLVDVY
jgi:hypothetical protein